MKTSFHSALVAAALLLSPAALYAVDQFTVRGVKSDRELQQELNGSKGFGPLERGAAGALIHGNLALPQGSIVQPDGSILGDDGSERLLENTAPFSLQSGVMPNSESMPPSGTLSSSLNEPPPEQANPQADFQD
jgi:hypothetical protein